MLTSSSGTNYVPNEHEDVDQYGSFTILSEIMPCESYPVSLGNQNEILIELECAASNGNRYPPYPQVMATAISQ